MTVSWKELEHAYGEASSVPRMLEAKTDTKYLFIDGRNVPLDNKHTQLNAQFKDRP